MGAVTGSGAQAVTIMDNGKSLCLFVSAFPKFILILKSFTNQAGGSGGTVNLLFPSASSPSPVTAFIALVPSNSWFFFNHPSAQTD